MLIDWFTVIAQAINFLILVWLMKRFLYQPILNALDAREKRIAAELADADAKKAEAQKERDEFQHKNEEFDQQRATLLSQATDEAKAERQRLLDEARKAADALSAKRMEALRNDAHNLSQAISRRTQQEVFAIARKALADLATTSLEERLCEVFTRRLREMDGQAKAGLADALKTASAPALVRSAFDLPEEQRTAIQNALNETFSAEIHVRFETAPDLVSGIELTTNGQKVAWSIADYLASLEKGVDELLKEKDKTEAQAQATKPSDLTPQIGKRAYELYEEHGHKEGLAVQDWEKAEREIRKEILKPVKTEPKPEAKAEPKSEVKPQTKVGSEPEDEAKPENKVPPKPVVKDASESAAKAEAKSATKVEPKPEAKAKPEPEAEAKPENKVEPKPAAKAEPVPAAKVEASPEVKPEIKPEAKTEPEHEAQAEPKPEDPKPETKRANEHGT
jgi:F-type H+-transporting ATPase subunit b